jgi:RNase P/RNase MRP subunit POP5
MEDYCKMPGKKTKRTKFKPSDREKKRYLVILSDIMNIREIMNSFSQSRWKIIDKNNEKIMIRLELKYLNKFKDILSNKKIKCIGVSGTIKRAKQKFWRQ